GRATDRNHVSLDRRPRGERVRTRAFARLRRQGRRGRTRTARAGCSRLEMGQPEGGSAEPGRNRCKPASAQRATAGDGKNLAWREVERTSRRRSVSGRPLRPCSSAFLSAAPASVMSGSRINSSNWAARKRKKKNGSTFYECKTV